MNTVLIEYETKKYALKYPKNEIKEFVGRICSEIGIDKCEFSVNFVSENAIHSANLQYRKIDASTDILSFAVEDDFDGMDFVVPSAYKRNLGDILICPEVMKRNVDDFNVSEQEELRRLLIHGILHLTGEDHKTNEASEPMLIKQEEILKKLN